MNVLILEDTMVWQELLCEVCRRNRWQPVSAQSIEEAIELLRTERIDTAIVDLMLPDSMDTDTALDVLFLFKQRLPRGRVCIVSGVDNLPPKIAGCPTVSKMFEDVETLSDSIRAALGLM